VAEFLVEGPFEIPIYRRSAGRIVRAQEGNAFFKAHSHLSGRRGCYVVGMRAGRGVTPTYVGKATKTFKQECFEPHKLGKLDETLVEYDRGTLVVFFIIAPTGRGRPPTSQIGDLEKFLIQAGVAKNPDLLNVKDTRQAEWSIKGVIRGKSGRPTRVSSAFKRAMSI